MIANSGHDEKGKYTGGSAGDQTGTEWQIRSWYKYTYGWGCVLRFPDMKVGEKIAEFAKQAAENDNIGYDQGNRTSFWTQLAKVGYKPRDIKTKCEADCSAGVSAIVKAVGYIMNIQDLKDISPTNYTGSMKPNFRAAGFEVLTDEKYLTSDKYLLPGDILLNEKHHTCINLDVGSKMTNIFKPEIKEGWVHDEDKDKWWYRYKDGSYPKSCWKTIDGKDYYFDSEGWLKTNQWIKSAEYDDNKKLYYVDDNGAWDEKTYMWEQEGDKWWLKCLDSSWFPKNEWCYIADKWYYFDKKGYMVTGTKTIGDKIYSFRKDGSLVE